MSKKRQKNAVFSVTFQFQVPIAVQILRLFKIVHADVINLVV